MEELVSVCLQDPDLIIEESNAVPEHPFWHVKTLNSCSQQRGFQENHILCSHFLTLVEFWLWRRFQTCASYSPCVSTIEVHSVNLESYLSMSLWVNCMSDSLRNAASRTLWTLFYATIISSELLREYLKEKNSACSHSPLKLLITVTCNNA